MVNLDYLRVKGEVKLGFVECVQSPLCSGLEIHSCRTDDGMGPSGAEVYRADHRESRILLDSISTS